MTQDPWEALASDLNGGASSTDPWEALASEVNGSAAPGVAPQAYRPRQAALESAQAAQAATAGLSMPSAPLSPQINGEGPLAPERLPTAQEFNQQALSSGAAGLAEIPAGLSDAVAIAATWLGNATGFDQQPLEKRATRKFAQAIRDFVREAVPPAPEEAGLGDSFLASKLPGALGQGVGFIGAGAMGQLAKVPAMMSSAVLGGAQNAQSQFWEAMAETDGDEEKAYEAFALGLGAGATEAFGIGGLLGRLSARTGGRLTRAMAGAARESVEEGAQETLQTVLNNAIAQHTYDDERELLRGWLENASLGMLSGGLLGGFLNAATTPSLGPSEQQVAQEAVEVAEEAVELATAEAAPEVAAELEVEPEAEAPLTEQEAEAPTADPSARKSSEPISEGTRSKLVGVLQETKPLREEQTRLVQEWRDEQSARVRGARDGAGSDLDQMNAMAGELAGGAPVVQMENLEDRFEPAEMQELAAHFKNHSLASDMSPQEHGGLWIATLKLLRHGEIPAPGALEKLGQIFGRDFAEAVSADYDGPRWPGAKRFLLEAMNTPRALKASFDLSAAGRQGLSMGLMHPTKVLPAFAGQMRAFASQEYSDALTNELRSSHYGKLFRRYGGEFTLPAGKVAAREEAFMSTWLQNLADADLQGWKRILEPVKLLGRGVRASDRAYAAYLNKMRLEVFSYWAQQYEAAGTEASPRQYRKLAKFVNALSGRGKAGPFEGEVWTALLWSPRFVTSRFEAPARALVQGFTKGDPVAIRSGWQALVSHSMAAIGLAALVKYAADLWDEDDLEVGLDWRSTDFLKIRHGSTRIDMAGGYGPAARLVAAWSTGERKNILSGKTEKTNPLISTLFFMRNKLAPVPSVAVSNLTGTDPTGAEPTAGSSLSDLYLPIAAQTFGEVMEEHGAVGLGYMVPELLGFGVSVHDYDPEKGEGAGDRTYHYNHLEDALRRGDEDKARAAWAALMSDRLATKDGTTETKRARNIRRTMERRGRGGDLLEEIAK